MRTMKRTMVTLALVLPVAAIMITGCQSPESKAEQARDKVQDAEEQVVVANQELIQTLNDSIRLFKTENGKIIVSYDQSIAEFKTKYVDLKEEYKINLENKLAMVEQKNRDMKVRLEEYKEEGEDNWKSFKNEFSHDMEELGKAFEDLTVNNVE